MADHGDDRGELLYKVLVVGDMGVGKTSVIKRYVHNIFTPNYKATIGVDFGLKELTRDGRTVRVQLWDIAGQERFGNLTRVYYKEAVGALVVADITKQDSLEAATKWKNDIDHKVYLPDDTPIPCLLLQNKCDLPNRVQHTVEEMDWYCKEHGFIGWFETSAKDNKGISEACDFLVTTIVRREQMLTQQAQQPAKAKQPEPKAQQTAPVSLRQKDQKKKKDGCC